MSTETIQIHLVTSWSTKDIITLYKAGGWWKESYNPTLVSQMIAGSFRFAVAVDTTTQATIGMGRVISDGISDAYIQDVIVLPKYRHKGIGHSLITRLVNECLTQGIVWIGLIAEGDSTKFYQPLGFTVMKDHHPMLLTMEK